MAEPTLFEKILSGEIPGNFICRGDGWGSFLDVFPRSEGHTLVVLENPSQRLADLSQQELGLLFSGVKETQETLSAYFDTSDFTVTIHDGPLQAKKYLMSTSTLSLDWPGTVEVRFHGCSQMQNLLIHQIFRVGRIVQQNRGG